MHHIILPNTKYRFLCYTILIISLLLALKGKTQEVAGFAKGAFNELHNKYYYKAGDFDPAVLTAKYDEQREFMERALGNDKRLRVLSAPYSLHTLPASVYDQIVNAYPNDIDGTAGTFRQYINNQGWSNDFYYTLQTKNDYGMFFAINQNAGAYGDQTSATVNSVNVINLTNMKKVRAHEDGHGSEDDHWNNGGKTQTITYDENNTETVVNIHNCFLKPNTPPNLPYKGRNGENKGDPSHPFGKNIETEYYNPDTGQWEAADASMTKSVMSAGTDSGLYGSFYTSSASNAITDENDFLYGTATWSDGTVFQVRVQASELEHYENGQNWNYTDCMYHYLTDVQPGRVQSTEIDPSKLPQAPSLSLNGNMLSVDASQYPATIDGRAVKYGYYLYHKNNAVNDKYINAEKGGIPLDEATDISQYIGQTFEGHTVNSPADLAVGVFLINGNKLSPRTTVEIQNQAPEAPQNLAVSNITPNSAVANWSPASDSDGSVVGYKVELKKGSQTIVNTETANTSFNFNNLDENTTYSLKVWSKDNEGAYSATSANESFQTIEAPNQAPEAPQNLAISNITPNAAVANWSPATDPDGSVVGYKVELKKGSQTIVNTETANTSFNFNNLDENTTYSLKVWSKDNDGVYSENFAETSFQTIEAPNQAPEAPQNLAVSNITPNAAVANWSPASDPDGSVVGYKVELKKGSQTIVNTETANTAFNFNGLDDNETYSLKVWSKDNDGAYSENFAETSFQTPESENEPPTPPQNPEASNITATTATVSWQPASDPDGTIAKYEVYANGTLQGTVLPNQTLSMALTNLNPNATNAVQIVAFDNEGASAAANLSVETPKLPDTTPPNEMSENTFLKDVHAHRVVLTLAQAITDNTSDPNQEVSGIDRVEIYVDGVYHSEIANPQVGDTQTIADLNPEQTYTFKYVATDNEGNQTEFEEEVTTDFDGIDENVAGIEVQAYPNPTIDKVKVNLPENAQVKNVMVYNLAGQLVKSNYDLGLGFSQQTVEIDLSGIAKGTYLLEIKTANTLFRGKLVKR